MYFLKTDLQNKTRIIDVNLQKIDNLSNQITLNKTQRLNIENYSIQNDLILIICQTTGTNR